MSDYLEGYRDGWRHAVVQVVIAMLLGLIPLGLLTLYFYTL